MTDSEVDKFEELPFLLHLESLGATHEFKTYAELHNWAKTEEVFWSNLKGLTNDSQNWGEQVADTLRNQFSRLSSWASSAETDHNARTNLKNMLHAIERGDWPVSEDTTGQLVTKFLSTDPHRAVAHAALASKSPFNFQNTNVTLLNAFINAKLDDLVDQDGVDAREKTLSNLRSRWDGRYRSIEARHNRLLDQTEEAWVTGKKIAKKAIRKSARQMAFHREKMDEAFTDHESRMSDLEEAFKTGMSVQAAETYWGNRLNENESKSAESRDLLVKVGGFGLVGVLLISVLATWLLPESIDVTKLSTLQMVVFGLPTLIYIWLLRLIISRWKRHNGLKEDAEQRLAMLSTFLALETGGDASKEERILMLSALFRSHDEESDEEVPNPVVSAVLNRLR